MPNNFQGPPPGGSSKQTSDFFEKAYEKKHGHVPDKKKKGKPNPALQRAAFARLQKNRKKGKKKVPPQFQKGNPFGGS